MHGSRIFLGGGVQGRPPENSLGIIFFLFFLVLNLFYSLQRGSNGFITQKTILTFSRGRPLMLISIETDFPGGGGVSRAPIPPSGSAHDWFNAEKYPNISKDNESNENTHLLDSFLDIQIYEGKHRIGARNFILLHFLKFCNG